VNDKYPFRAELFGGPLDGQIVTVPQGLDLLRMPIPPGRPSLADSEPMTDLGPAIAQYEIIEYTYVEPRDPFLPKRIATSGKYRWRP
jgi:hypothetical protein